MNYVISFLEFLLKQIHQTKQNTIRDTLSVYLSVSPQVMSWPHGSF